MLLKDPRENSKGCWGNRTMGMVEAEDWQDLIAHSRRWTKGEPDNHEAWHWLGMSYEVLGLYQEAIEAR